MLEGSHLISQSVLLLDHHLNHLHVTLVSPPHEGTFLLPGVHVREYNLPVAFCILEQVFVGCPRVENAAKISLLKGPSELINTLLILILLLDVKHSFFVKVESLSKELFPRFCYYKITFVLLQILSIS